MTIQIISASAGSGKTYRLATILEDEVKSKNTNPDKVVATTFTKKAAAELMERVRIRLIRANEIEAAQRLQFARLGTVNSICSKLLVDYAFELGLSPRLRVLDEAVAEDFLKKAQSQVLSEPETVELAELQSRLEGLSENPITKKNYWDDHVATIVDLARTNGISAKMLNQSAKQSVSQFLDLLGKPVKTAESFNQSIISEMKDFLKVVEKASDQTKGTKDITDKVTSILRRLQENQIPSWGELCWLSNNKPAKKTEEAYKPLQKLLADHHLHPKFQEDCSRVITLAFEVAGKALAAYQSYKDEHGVIDFIDQEEKALELLQDEAVKKRLQEDIDLVLVDEFQDTSPLQLAIFMSLADLAHHDSYWVGDQKQSIYAFRGTDPKLMDAAIAQILAGNEPETLPYSFRSRAPLVHLTSNLFAKAFEADKLPEKRVKIAPVSEDDDPSLGSVLTHWRYDSKNKTDDASAVASGVKALLESQDSLVRDPITKEPRHVKGSDVAVLCRTNSDGRSMARALETVGIRAAVATVGLMGTPEVRLVHATLRLWIDPNDRLASAEILRLTTCADKPNQWLEQAIVNKDKPPMEGEPLFEKLRKARGEHLRLGTIEAFDKAMEAIEVWEWCLRWGDSVLRQSNLEALRALAVAFVSGKAGDVPATIADLVIHFDELARNGTDQKAAFEGEDAVFISTWHGAKGLEWPIVVLYSLETGVRDNSLGVGIVSDNKSMAIKAPLAGRWIRYWPTPFHSKTQKSGMHRALVSHPVSLESKAEDERQLRRLLYVAWTRARDQVILTSRSGKLTDGIIGLLKDGKRCLLEELNEKEEVDGILEIDLAGYHTQVRLKKLVPIPESNIKPTPGVGFVLPDPCEYPPSWVSPSQLVGTGAVGKAETIGNRLKLPSNTDMEAFGNALHGFMAADRKALQKDQRILMAKGLLDRWGFGDSISSNILVEASERLIRWVEKRWPGAIWHREIPMMHRLPNGSIIRGNCDLALEAKDGWVVVDHKSFPGNAEEGIKRAGEYAAQLIAYAQTIEAATGKKVIGMHIHMPTIGLVVGVLPSMEE